MTHEYFLELKSKGKLIWDSEYQAYYYPKWDKYYNRNGQQLRHKEEYNQFFNSTIYDRLFEKYDEEISERILDNF